MGVAEGWSSYTFEHDYEALSSHITFGNIQRRMPRLQCGTSFISINEPGFHHKNTWIYTLVKQFHQEIN